jgi:2'-5' RNA ligase
MADKRAKQKSFNYVDWNKLYSPETQQTQEIEPTEDKSFNYDPFEVITQARNRENVLTLLKPTQDNGNGALQRDTGISNALLQKKPFKPTDTITASESTKQPISKELSEEPIKYGEEEFQQGRENLLKGLAQEKLRRETEINPLTKLPYDQTKLKNAPASDPFVNAVNVVLSSGLRTVPGTIEALGLIGDEVLRSAIKGEYPHIADTAPPSTISKITEPIGKGLTKTIEEKIPVDPKRQKFLESALPSAIGSGLGFIIGGSVAQAVKVPTFVSSLLLSFSQASDEYNQAIQQTGSKELAYRAFIQNLPFAATEVLPFERLFNRIQKLGGVRGKELLIEMLSQGTVEGTQEQIQQFGANLTAQQIYDTQRELSKGTNEGGLAGFITGMFLSGLSNIATQRINEGGISNEDSKLLTQTLDKINQEKNKVDEKVRKVLSPKSGFNEGKTIDVSKVQGDFPLLTLEELNARKPGNIEGAIQTEQRLKPFGDQERQPGQRLENAPETFEAAQQKALERFREVETRRQKKVDAKNDADTYSQLSARYFQAQRKKQIINEQEFAEISQSIPTPEVKAKADQLFTKVQAQNKRFVDNNAFTLENLSKKIFKTKEINSLTDDQQKQLLNEFNELKKQGIKEFGQIEESNLKDLREQIKVRKDEENAIRQQKTNEILQRQQEEITKARSERERVERIEQGTGLTGRITEGTEKAEKGKPQEKTGEVQEIIAQLEPQRKQLEKDYGKLEDLSETELKNLATKKPDIKSIVEQGGGKFDGIQKVNGEEKFALATDPETRSTFYVPLEGITPEAVKTKLEKGREKFKPKEEKIYWRGVREDNINESDKFYSIDKEVAAEYAIQKVGDKPQFETIKESELPKNIYETTNKEDLAVELGYWDKKNREWKIDIWHSDFDKAVKEKLQKKGYGGIRYKEGTDFEGVGIEELHIFGKPKEPLPETSGEKLSSTQVNIPETDQKPFIDFANEIPEKELYTKEEDPNNRYGRETEPHVTVLYGLKTTDPKEVKKLIENYGDVELTLGKTSLFKQDEYDVLKVDVESKELRELNKKLKENLDYESDFPNYKPHLTIAYLKPGEGQKYVGDNRFDGQKIKLSEILFADAERNKTPINLKPLPETKVKQPYELRRDEVIKRDELKNADEFLANIDKKLQYAEGKQLKELETLKEYWADRKKKLSSPDFIKQGLIGEPEFHASATSHKKLVQKAITEGKITSHPDYPELSKVEKKGEIADLSKVSSAASRFRPKEFIQFKQPLKGKSGAELIGYEWKYEWEDLGDDKARRISDWTQSEISPETGREIVHQFHVRTPDGKTKVVSAESVLGLLGFTEANVPKNFPNIISTAKTLAKNQMKLAAVREQNRLFYEAVKENLKKPKPEIIMGERKTEFNMTWWKMGDEAVIQDDFKPINDERRKRLEESWAEAEAKKQGLNKSYVDIIELEARIARQRKKLDQALTNVKEEKTEPEKITPDRIGKASDEQISKVKIDNKEFFIVKSPEGEDTGWIRYEGKDNKVYLFDVGNKKYVVFKPEDDKKVSLNKARAKAIGYANQNPLKEITKQGFEKIEEKKESSALDKLDVIVGEEGKLKNYKPQRDPQTLEEAVLDFLVSEQGSIKPTQAMPKSSLLAMGIPVTRISETKGMNPIQIFSSLAPKLWDAKYGGQQEAPSQTEMFEELLSKYDSHEARKAALKKLRGEIIEPEVDKAIERVADVIVNEYLDTDGNLRLTEIIKNINEIAEQAETDVKTILAYIKSQEKIELPKSEGSTFDLLGDIDQAIKQGEITDETKTELIEGTDPTEFSELAKDIERKAEDAKEADELGEGIKQVDDLIKEEPTAYKAEQKDLIVIHNLNSENLKFADRVGGLAMPSLAIIKRDIGLDKYGDVTLIANKDLIDPRYNKVFNRDVYSPTYPTVYRHINKKQLDGKFGEIKKSIDKIILDSLDHNIGQLNENLLKGYNTIEGQSHNDLLQVYYLAKTNQLPKPILRYERLTHLPQFKGQYGLAKELLDKYPIVRDGIKVTEAEIQAEFDEMIKDENAYNWIKDKTEREEIIRDRARETAKGRKQDEYEQEILKFFNDYIDGYVEVQYEGKAYKDIADDELRAYAEDSKKNWKEKRLHPYSYTNDIEALRNPKKELSPYDYMRKRVEPLIEKQNKEYLEFLNKEFDDVFGSEYLLKGKSKIPHTLDNAMDIMGGNIKGVQKTLVQGLGKSAAQAAKEFNSIEQIKKNKDRIVSHEQFEIADNKMRDAFFKLSDRLSHYYPSRDFGFERLDDLSLAIGRISKSNLSDNAISRELSRVGYNRVPDLYYEDVKEVAELMKDMPTEYFEAKKVREVGLKEFVGALVPDNVDPKVLEILKKNGIERVVKYKYRDAESRTQALQEFEDVMFEQRAEYGVEKVLAEPFYSKLERVIQEKLPNKGFTKQSVLSMLKNNGVKDAEIEWMDLENFLNEPRTKQEVLDFLKMNQLKVEEVQKGGGNEEVLYDIANNDQMQLPKEHKRLQDFIELNNDYMSEDFENESDDIINQREIDIEDEREWLEHRGYSISLDDDGFVEKVVFNRTSPENESTKYSQYITPGGENYREILFTLPAKKKMSRGKLRVEEDENNVSGRELYRVLDEDNNVVGTYSKKKFAQDMVDTFDNVPVELDTNLQPAFKSSHWDEPNVFAHLRANDRVVDGKRYLHIEEIQSDWAISGRKQGYRNENIDKVIRDKEAEISKYEKMGSEIAKKYDDKRQKKYANRSYDFFEYLAEIEPQYKENQTKWVQLKNELESFKQQTGSTPNFPFKNNWHEFVLKRALRMAAEEGYDGISWTTGEQQAERYDLSKQVDDIKWKYKDGKYSFNANPITDAPNIIRDNLSIDELESNIGKEAVKHIQIEIEKGNNSGTLEGESLKVGATWAKNLYDRTIPNFLNTYAKKWGAKVGEVELQRALKWSIQEVDDTFAVVDQNGNNRFIPPEYFDTREAAQEHINNRVNNLTVHSLPITESMKKSVLTEGQTLFELPTMYGRENADEITRLNDYKRHLETTIPLLESAYKKKFKNVNPGSDEYVKLLAETSKESKGVSDAKNELRTVNKKINALETKRKTLQTDMFKPSTQIDDEQLTLFEKQGRFARDEKQIELIFGKDVEEIQNTVIEQIQNSTITERGTEEGESAADRRGQPIRYQPEKEAGQEINKRSIPEELRTFLKQFRDTGQINLNGTKLGDNPAQDLGDAFKIARNPFTETMWLIGVKDGVVVKNIGISSDASGYVNITPKVRKDALNELKTAGATELYLTHNHPSGNPTPSNEDFAFATKFGQEAQELGISAKESIVINGDEFSHWEISTTPNSSGQYEATVKQLTYKNPKTHPAEEFYKEFDKSHKVIIKSPLHSAQYFGKLKYGDGVVAVVVVASNNTVRGYEYVNAELVRDTKKLGKYIDEVTASHGGASVFLVGEKNDLGVSDFVSSQYYGTKKEPELKEISTTYSSRPVISTIAYEDGRNIDVYQFKQKTKFKLGEIVAEETEEYSDDMFKTFRDYARRIDKIANIFELNNWKRKHKDLISQFDQATQQRIENLLTAKRLEFSKEPIAERQKLYEEKQKEKYDNFLKIGQEIFEKEQTFVNWSREMQKRAGKEANPYMRQLYRDLIKRNQKEAQKSGTKENIYGQKVENIDYRKTKRKERIADRLISQNLDKDMQQKILNFAEKYILNNKDFRMSKDLSGRFLTQFKEKVGIMARQYGPAGGELAQRIAKGNIDQSSFLEQAYEYIYKIGDVFENKDVFQTGEISDKVIDALEDRKNADEILKDNPEAKSVYDLSVKLLDWVKERLTKSGYPVRENYFTHIRDLSIIDEILSDIKDPLKTDVRGTNQFISSDSRFLKPREFDTIEIRRDLLGVVKSYIHSVGKALSYKDAVDYYYTDFKNDIPERLKKRRMEIAIDFMKANLSPEISTGLFYRSIFFVRNTMYRSFLAFNLRASVQNHLQKDFARLYIAPEAKRVTDKLFYLRKQLTGNIQRAIAETKAETPTYLEISDAEQTNTFKKLWETVGKVEPFQLMEKTNWSYSEIAGVVNNLMKRPEYKQMKSEGMDDIAIFNKMLEDQDTYSEAVRSGIDLAANTQVSPTAAYRPFFYDKPLMRILGMFTRFKFTQLQHIAQTLLSSKEGIDGLRAQRILRRGLTEEVEPVEILREVEINRKAINKLFDLANKKNTDLGIPKEEIKKYLDYLESQETELNQAIKELEPLKGGNVKMTAHWGKYYLKLAVMSVLFQFGYDIFDAAIRGLVGDDDDDEKKQTVGRIALRTFLDLSPLPFYSFNPSNFLNPPIIPNVEPFLFGNFNARGMVKALAQYGLNVIPGLGVVDRATGRTISNELTDIIAPKSRQAKSANFGDMLRKRVSDKIVPMIEDRDNNGVTEEFKKLFKTAQEKNVLTEGQEQKIKNVYQFIRQAVLNRLTDDNDKKIVRQWLKGGEDAQQPTLPEITLPEQYFTY